jgi:tetratricopeptide (TPR) repeat protein
MDTEKEIPSVFISYCWTSENHKNWVRSLADKLVRESGIEVILDQWHGKIGHDRFHFMEDSIRVADKVLVICDKKYCDRANGRAGGVGTETRIITPEVYRSSKQDKFIPIALEYNEHNEYLLPDFMSSRFALGMTKEEEFESDYRQLERLIWQVPLLNPPVRGKKPDFETEGKKQIISTKASPLDASAEENQIKQNKYYRVPKRNVLFSGRERELTDIDTSLDADDIFIISGLSGLGKSQIAKEYLHRNYNQFSTICWITATNYYELIKEFSSLALYFDVHSEPEKLEDTILIEVIKQYFSNLTNVLLIIDNADKIDIGILNSCIPSKVKIIITTQNSTWDDNEYKGMVIEGLDPIDARNFILKNSKKRLKTHSDSEDVDRLAKLLSYHPLALEYARAYINKRKICVQLYLELFSKHSIELFNTKASDYQKPELTAWKISLQSAVEISNKAEDFLANCSVLSTYSIPINIIFKDNNIFNQVDLDKIIHALMGFSLVEAIEDGNVRMHSLTQEYIRLIIKEKGTYKKYIDQQMMYVLSAFPNSINSREDKEKTKILMPHGLSILSYIVNDKSSIEATLNFTRKISSKLYNFGNYTEAIKCIEDVIEICEKNNFVNDNYIGLLSNLAMSYYYIGSEEKNLYYFDLVFKNLEKHRTVIKEHYNELASIAYGNKGITLKDKEQYEESLICYERSIEYARKANNIDFLLNQLNNIGIIYRYREKYDMALESLEECLTLCKDNKKLEAKTLANLAYVHKDMDSISYAASLFEKALKIFEDIEELRSCSITHDHLGCCYLIMEEYEKSIESLQTALKIAEDIGYAMGKAHSLYNIGNYHLKYKKDFKLAKLYFEKCLHISSTARYEKGCKKANEAIQSLKIM